MLPAEMQGAWGNLLGLHETSRGKEWHSACPKCGDAGHDYGDGDPNRFVIVATGRKGKPFGFCRKCGHKEFADASRKPTEDEIRDTQETIKRIEAHRKREHKRKLGELRDKAEWIAFNRNLKDEHIEWWASQGIPEFWVYRWGLGFVAGKLFEHRGQFFLSDSYTIPIFDWNNELVQTQYRLVSPPENSGKYRQTFGIPPSCFIASPKIGVDSKTVIVVEGSKKGMVVYLLVSALGKNHDIQVIAIPGDRTWCGLTALLGGAKRVFTVLDPGSEAWSRNFTSAVGNNAKSVFLPQKPDDMILAGATIDDMRHYFAKAERT